MPKKTKKYEKGASPPLVTERCGGLAVAGGEVRRVKSFGPGDSTQWFRIAPAPRWGTAN